MVDIIICRQKHTKYPKNSKHTFAHSGTVVNDKGGDIFVISHGEISLLFD
jgi:hypothetical protein